MELAAEHISSMSILSQLNRRLWLNKDLVQAIGRTTPTIFMAEGLVIKIKNVYMNDMNMEMMKIIVGVDK